MGEKVPNNDGKQVAPGMCDGKTEVYSRVCGFMRPVQQWNKGKKEEFKERKEFVVDQNEINGGDDEDDCGPRM